MRISPIGPAELDAATALLGGVWPDARVVAAEKLFAPGSSAPSRPWGAFVGDALMGIAVTSGRFLRLLAVADDARGNGVGSALLAHAESIVGADHATLVLAAQPGNYFLPGVPVEDAATIDWLERRGFRATGTNTNLLVEVANNPRVSHELASAARERAATAGIVIGRARAVDTDVIELARGFGEAWAVEVERALAGEIPGVHVARDAEGAAVAFAAHDGNNRGLGWFGPAGTRASDRGRGLGGALLLACLVDVAAAGHARATIAWIGPRDFYERAVGVIGERRFQTFEKSMENMS